MVSVATEPVASLGEQDWDSGVRTQVSGLATMRQKISASSSMW